jgi:hypothetical protein
VGGLIADLIDKVRLSFLDAEARDFLEHLQLAFLYQRDLLLLVFSRGDLVGQRVVFLVDRVDLAVQVFFLLLQAALLLGELGPALFDFPLVL